MIAPGVPGVEADLASPGLHCASAVFGSASARSRWRCMSKRRLFRGLAWRVPTEFGVPRRGPNQTVKSRV